MTPHRLSSIHSRERAAGQTRRLSRRQLLGTGVAAASALALSPGILTACGSPRETSAPTSSSDNGAPATGTVRISNWPLYMADGFIAGFQQASGLTVDYREDFNDNEEWFAKHKEEFARGQDIGSDLAVPTMFMAGRLNSLGWLREINHDRVPNFANLRRDLFDDASDPGRKFSAPYMSGFVGLVYNRAATGRDITTIDDLWDPSFKGRVSLLSDVQDGLGMIMQSQGSSIKEPTLENVQKAADLVRDQRDRGQIRRFTGADYVNDVAAGNVAIAQGYSGDAVQLHADNPDLRFVVPDSGGTTFVDAMVIPSATLNQQGAETWIDYVYDRANYAKLIAFVQFVPVLADMTEELQRISPKLAADPLINPPQTTLARVAGWPTLTDEQATQFNDAYAAVTAG